MGTRQVCNAMGMENNLFYRRMNSRDGRTKDEAISLRSMGTQIVPKSKRL
jgi:hypothetical protein